MDHPLRTCSRCLHWDRWNSGSKDGVVVAPCERPKPSKSLAPQPVTMTTGGHACEKWAKGPKPQPIWHDYLGY